MFWPRVPSGRLMRWCPSNQGIGSLRYSNKHSAGNTVLDFFQVPRFAGRRCRPWCEVAAETVNARKVIGGVNIVERISIEKGWLVKNERGIVSLETEAQNVPFCCSTHRCTSAMNPVHSQLSLCTAPWHGFCFFKSPILFKLP